MFRSLFAGVLGAAMLAFAGVASAAAVDAKLGYIVTLGGINIANVDARYSDDGASYRIGLDAKVSGLGQVVASGTAATHSSGRSSTAGLTSESFDLTTRANGEDFSVKVGYAGKQVSSFVVEPPLVDQADRIPIERSQLAGVGDMLAGFILKGAALDKTLCQRKLAIFTGVERFDLDLSYAAADVATSPRTGYQGPVVLCSVRYKPISGHYTTSDITNYLAKSNKILVWFAPLGQTGTYIPYRALLPTTVGDLSMVLTSMKY